MKTLKLCLQIRKIREIIKNNKFKKRGKLCKEKLEGYINLSVKCLAYCALRVCAICKNPAYFLVFYGSGFCRRNIQ